MSVAAELKDIRETLAYIVQHMVTKEELKETLDKEIRSLRSELKIDLFQIQTQVNSIEHDIHEMKLDRLPVRVADLEEKVFGKPR